MPISLVIATVLALQAIAGFNLIFGPIERAPFLYPFLDYPMYSWPASEGAVLHQFALEGITGDSTVVEIPPEDLGLSFWLHLRGPIQAVRDEDRDELQAHARNYERRTGRRLLAFRLTDTPILIYADSLPEQDERVVATVWLDGAEGP